ncbi:MAG: zinc-dependent alcohol dehydrogenase family protein [Burkholderiaceae bacterium]
MLAWQMVSGDGIDSLEQFQPTEVDPGPGQVTVAIKANSVNYRDYMIVSDPIARNIALPRIPNSDGAGQIVAVGPGVQGLQIGDRVATCFFQDWVDGPCSVQAMNSAMGGAIDGVLSRQVVLSATGVVKIPDALSYEEASTLPCAALTAWRAIVVEGQVKSGDTVLLLGTGGVSIFALQFLTMMGARAIITSSSGEKLQRAKQMGAWQTINYRTHPDWEQEVLKLTDGVGVDLVVEVGGAGTIARSVAATRVAGRIALIGILSGGQFDPTAIMRKSINLQGIYVGSQAMFKDMVKAIDANGLKPVIDQVFGFNEAPAAYWSMAQAKHFGKIVISV